MALSVADAAFAALSGMPVRRVGAGSKSGAPRSASRPAHRTGAPVLRDSIEAGTFEEAFFAVPAKGETDRLLHVARRTLDAARRLRRDARAGLRELTVAERAIARLTAGAVRLFEEILTLARLNRGRVFPSYDYLAEATGLGRATVGRALAILEGVGFLIRQRRFDRVAGTGPGPRYKQTSNVYRPLLPKGVLAYLPRWMRPAPLPDDDVQRREGQAADVAAMLENMSCRDLAQVTVRGPLAKILGRIGAAVDAAAHVAPREAQNDPQPLNKSVYKEAKALASPANRSI